MTQTELSDDQIEAERAAFERYFSENGKHPKAVERFPWGGYKLASAASAWTTWHARALMAREAVEVPQWQPIETAPRGSGEDGPDSVRHPDYVEPPKLLLWTEEGPVVGYYDWYYHPGYGRGAEPGESTWRDQNGGRTYGASHWMPLPASPTKGQL